MSWICTPFAEWWFINVPTFSYGIGAMIKKTLGMITQA